jgi:membrane-anchored protein YejM (alkaline phosphatase superfamily)
MENNWLSSWKQSNQFDHAYCDHAYCDLAYCDLTVRSVLYCYKSFTAHSTTRYAQSAVVIIVLLCFFVYSSCLLNHLASDVHHGAYSFQLANRDGV